MADRQVDSHYSPLRAKHNHADAAGNGYLSEGFFRREQKFLLGVVQEGMILDAASGSGLMLLPLYVRNDVICLDYNETACLQAAENHLPVARGDVFRLPFGQYTFDTVVNCQFFNQQKEQDVIRFIEESYRVLKPGGECHLLWRGGHTLVHRIANTLVTTANRLLRKPEFPQYIHSMERVALMAHRAGFRIQKHCMTLPFGPASLRASHPLCQYIGASCYLQLRRPDEDS